MGRFLYGFRILFRIWRDAEFTAQVRLLEQGKRISPPPPAPAPAKMEPRRSDALTLLSVLQREARFVDFIKESIAAYSDAQIGAAVRDVHASCAAALDRLFSIEPLQPAAEGSQIEVPRGFDPARFRLAGNVAGEPPFRGKLAHHGWKAARCDLPEWTGTEASAPVIAPAEVELK